MTVAELKTALKDVPDEAQVVYLAYGEEYEDLTKVVIAKHEKPIGVYLS